MTSQRFRCGTDIGHSPIEKIAIIGRPSGTESVGRRGKRRRGGIGPRETLDLREVADDRVFVIACRRATDPPASTPESEQLLPVVGGRDQDDDAQLQRGVWRRRRRRDTLPDHQRRRVAAAYASARCVHVTANIYYRLD